MVPVSTSSAPQPAELPSAEDGTKGPSSSAPDLATARAELFRLLAAGFLHPSRELARGLVDGAYPADLRACVAVLGWPTTEAGRAAVTRLDELMALLAARESEAVYHELAVEYARLFIGPGPIVISPYESIHVDQTADAAALVMVSRTATAVEAAYREAGLKPRSDPHEPPDHVATELEFLYYICFREADALAQDDIPTFRRWEDRRVAFAESHVEAWVPGLCRTVADASNGPFYSRLAEILVTAVAVEASRRD